MVPHELIYEVVAELIIYGEDLARKINQFNNSIIFVPPLQSRILISNIQIVRDDRSAWQILANFGPRTILERTYLKNIYPERLCAHSYTYLYTYIHALV